MNSHLAAALLPWLLVAAPAAAQPKLCAIPCATQCRPMTGPALAECETRCAAQHRQLCAVPAAKSAPQGVGGGHAPAPVHHYHQSPGPAPAPPPAPLPPPVPPPPVPPVPAAGAPPHQHHAAPHHPAAAAGGEAPPVPVAGGLTIGALAGGLENTQPIASRLFTDAQFPIPADYGAVAVLAFRNDAGVDGDRMLMVCRAYVAALPVVGDVAREFPHAQQMVTLWPVKPRSTALDPDNDSVHGAGTDVAVCPAAVKDYDFTAATGWLSSLHDVSFGDARGPFLIAWAPPAVAGHAHVAFLVYDLSAFETKTEFRRAMAIWADEIESNPAAWAGGWNLTKFRLDAAAMADHFGGEIAAAIKLVPFVGDH